MNKKTGKKAAKKSQNKSVKTEIQIIEPEAKSPVVNENFIDVNSFISKALDKGEEGVLVLKELLALQERQQKKIALAEFNRAKSECQPKLPVIRKTRCVYIKNSTDVKYRYADLNDARAQCMPIISQFGFSDSYETEMKSTGMNIIYRVRHNFGHEESTSMFCPTENSEYMNNIQKSGSTVTYGKKYAFSNYWGLILDEDDDGQGAGKPGEPAQKPKTLDTKAAIDQLTASISEYKYLKNWQACRKWLGEQKGVWSEAEVVAFFESAYDDWASSQINTPTSPAQPPEGESSDPPPFAPTTEDPPSNEKNEEHK